MLFGPAAAVINHLLRDSDWARERLAHLPAARSIRYRPSAAFTVQADDCSIAVGH
jgi:hypothetical protein